jgi:hypothetical protein
MPSLIQTVNDGSFKTLTRSDCVDGDEETAEFSREARVSFGSSVEVINIDDSSVDRPTR